MRLLWYGCSWVRGVRKGIVPFPELVSCNLDLEYENRGYCGSSIDQMVADFSNDYNNNRILESDVVIFCATSSYRITWDNYFQFSFNMKKRNEKEKYWLLNFADDDICSFLAFKNLSLIYFMCKSINIKCFFVNSYYPLSQQISNLIPLENWLMHYNQSCVNLFEFEIIKPEPIFNDSPEFKHNVWINHKEKIEKYLIPNDNHPNQLGNKTIADYLTFQLNEKL